MKQTQKTRNTASREFIFYTPRRSLKELTMFKKIIFAVVPMMLLATVTIAEDNLLSGLDVSSIQDADISIEEANVDLDFDALSGEAGDEEGEEAIEACFRRFGYRSFGYRSYGFRGYGYGRGYSCYRPCYSHYYTYRPVYRPYCYPVVRTYWGCY